MVGAGLKKLAKEQGLTVDSGVAYGSFKGYAVTLSEGAGVKRIDIATKLPDAEQQRQLENAVHQVDLAKTYRVQELVFGHSCISVIFVDNPGTMKKMTEFTEWLFPLLNQHGAQGVNICAECGADATGSGWYLIDGVAYRMHDSCAGNVQEAMNVELQQRKEEDTGSYASGALGAFLGAALGAALWAVILSFGYVASLVGFVIGWLAEKGYTLLRGKQGKGKLVILILAVIFGVLLGTLVPDAVQLGSMIAAGEFPGYTYMDIPGMIVTLFAASPEYRGATLANSGMGLLFAALGVFGLMAKTKKETAVPKMKKLK